MRKICPATFRKQGVISIDDYHPAGSFERQLRDYKVKLAVTAVRENNGNKTLAARSLHISRAYLHRLIRLAEPELCWRAKACFPSKNQLRRKRRDECGLVAAIGEPIHGLARAGILRRVFLLSRHAGQPSRGAGCAHRGSRFDDPDMWWHLKTGEIIWTTHHIPTTDIFSYTTNHHACIAA